MHTFNPCIQETTAKKLSVFNASMVYVVSFRTAGAVLRGPMSEKKKLLKIKEFSSALSSGPWRLRAQCDVCALWLPLRLTLLRVRQVTQIL